MQNEIVETQLVVHSKYLGKFLKVVEILDNSQAKCIVGEGEAVVVLPLEQLRPANQING